MPAGRYRPVVPAPDSPNEKFRGDGDDARDGPTDVTRSLHDVTDEGQLDPVSDVPIIDPLAVVSPSGGELLVDLVHRDATTGELTVTVELEDGDHGESGFEPGAEATVTVLAGETMADENTLEAPETVIPSQTAVPINDRSVTVSVPPFSFVRVTMPRAE